MGLMGIPSIPGRIPRLLTSHLARRILPKCSGTYAFATCSKSPSADGGGDAVIFRQRIRLLYLNHICISTRESNKFRDVSNFFLQLSILFGCVCLPFGAHLHIDIVVTAVIQQHRCYYTNHIDPGTIEEIHQVRN
jgi:hypothetical protein